MHSETHLEMSNTQQKDLIAIAEIVDYCCNTSTYSGMAYEATLEMIEEKPYCWKHVEKQFDSALVERKKKEILDTVERRFAMHFPSSYKAFLLEDPFCTFRGIETIVCIIVQRDELDQD